MSEEFYLNSLYPLQDKVLKIIEGVSTLFYLTWGTALSRGYLNHRFSDDIDLFMNNSETFKESVSAIIRDLSLNFPGNVEIGISDTTFYRIIVKENKTVLKCDFVNDSTCHYGDTESASFFSKIDNPYNILSNKISALPRSEPKDVADILFLSYK